MPDPDTLDPTDPRPVLSTWATASAAERGAHGAAVKKWKARELAREEERAARKAAERGSGSGPGVEREARHADDLATLEAIIHSAPIMSDRIRAVEAKQRILARVEEEERAQEHGPLVALGEALSAIPEGQRVSALGQLLGVEGLSA